MAEGPYYAAWTLQAWPMALRITSDQPALAGPYNDCLGTDTLGLGKHLGKALETLLKQIRFWGT